MSRRTRGCPRSPPVFITIAAVITTGVVITTIHLHCHYHRHRRHYYHGRCHHYHHHCHDNLHGDDDLPVTVPRQVLANLQKSGAKTFLLTNSGWDYSNKVTITACSKLTIEICQPVILLHVPPWPGDGLPPRLPWGSLCWSEPATTTTITMCHPHSLHPPSLPIPYHNKLHQLLSHHQH